MKNTSGGGLFRLPKKYLFLIILILFLFISSFSYAYWKYSDTQDLVNVVGTKCLQLTMHNETEGITILDAAPMSDEKGKTQEGYTFTIKNTCNTIAYYQVNLEEELENNIKRLSNEYIKVSLNESEGKLLSKYEEVDTTIKEEDFTSDESHKLTSDRLNPNEEKEYTLKLWMADSTPAIEEVMDATFESKVSIIAVSKEEEELENTITISYIEPEYYSRESEEVTITATSETYNLIEYSIDNKVWNSLEKEGTNVTIKLTYKEEGRYKIYFKDEAGNIGEQEIIITKIDKEGPEIHIEEIEKERDRVSISITFQDVKSGLKEYRILDEENNEEWQTFNEEEIITYTSTKNQTIIIEGKDQLNNISRTEYKIERKDEEGPIILVKSNHEDEWTKEDVTIEITATDDNSGLNKLYYKKQNESDWKEIENASIENETGSASVTFSETEESTYEFKATDNKGNESIETSIVKIDKENPEINDIYVGSMLYKDPTFKEGLNDVKVYNNLLNGNVTIQRERMETPTGSGWGLTITSNGEAYPGLGGFSFSNQTSSNKIFIARIIAKIPVGYYIAYGGNPAGDGATQNWLTDVNGTGEWKEYIFILKCGNIGTFWPANSFYLDGAKNYPVTWQIAYATVFDIGKWGQENYAIVTGKDNVSINKIGMNQGSEEPSYNDINQKEFATLIDTPITSNGTYNAWVKDEVDNTSNKNFEVTKVDTTLPIINNIYVGNMMYTDPTFKEGMNAVIIYNNMNNGNVTVTREAMQTPTGSGWGLTIKTSDNAYPGVGGFGFQTRSHANQFMITRIIAKVPEGYNLLMAGNSCNGTCLGLTDTKGIGDWKEYFFYIKTGSASNENYFYLSGPENFPVEWQVAYATVFDIGVYGTNNYAIVTGSDTSGISSFGINQSSSTMPTFTETNNSFKFAAMLPNPITINTNYYAWLKDGAGNVNYKLFNTNNLTNNISNVNIVSNQDSITISIEQNENDENKYYFELNDGIIQTSESNVATFSNLKKDSYKVKVGIIDKNNHLKIISENQISL